MPTKTKKKKKQAKTKKVSKPKQASKKGAVKKHAPSKKATPKKKKALKRSRPRGRSDAAESVVFEPKGLGARSGGQSGDLQGLSNREGADSESVDELLEEGNAFEAEIIKGIEDVPDADQGEIRTREVPEDDVPEEYLEKDE